MTDPILSPEQLQALAAAGIAAPSIHNTQPWCFRTTVDARTFRVYADRSRALPVLDPQGRALHISVGAALFNLRVAAHHLGREPSVHLLPHGSEPSLLAELDLGKPATDPEPFGRDLYPAISQRHSSRQPFANRDVPEAVISELITAAHAEDAELSALEEAGVRRVMDLTGEAEQRTAADPARVAETRQWLRSDDSAPDGIPQAALGPQDHEARVPMRSFTGYPPTGGGHSERFEALPQLATLSTRTDWPTDWLGAGQALERVWLLATVHGVRVSVLHQALEWPDTRWKLRDPAEGPGHVQLVLRLGYGPPGPRTPRRTVEDVLIAAEDRDAA